MPNVGSRSHIGPADIGPADKGREAHGVKSPDKSASVLSGRKVEQKAEAQAQKGGKAKTSFFARIFPDKNEQKAKLAEQTAKLTAIGDRVQNLKIGLLTKGKLPGGESLQTKEGIMVAVGQLRQACKMLGKLDKSNQKEVKLLENEIDKIAASVRTPLYEEVEELKEFLLNTETEEDVADLREEIRTVKKSCEHYKEQGMDIGNLEKQIAAVERAVPLKEKEIKSNLKAKFIDVKAKFMAVKALAQEAKTPEDFNRIRERVRDIRFEGPEGERAGFESLRNSFLQRVGSLESSMKSKVADFRPSKSSERIKAQEAIERHEKMKTTKEYQERQALIAEKKEALVKEDDDETALKPKQPKVVQQSRFGDVDDQLQNLHGRHMESIGSALGAAVEAVSEAIRNLGQVDLDADGQPAPTKQAPGSVKAAQGNAGKLAQEAANRVKAKSAQPKTAPASAKGVGQAAPLPPKEDPSKHVEFRNALKELKEVLEANELQANVGTRGLVKGLPNNAGLRDEIRRNLLQIRQSVGDFTPIKAKMKAAEAAFEARWGEKI